MEKQITNLEEGVDDQEQSNRRLCLSVDGMEMEEKKSGGKYLVKVKSVFRKLEMNVADDFIDKANQIEKPKVVNGKNMHTMILNFTPWRHCTGIAQGRMSHHTE